MAQASPSSTTAERLFGDHGMDGVSLRAIMTQADANPAAVHYHFGSKEALVEAIVLRRMGTETAVRAALLDAAGPEPSIEAVVTALVRSMADLVASGPSGRSYVRFLARLFADRSSSLVESVLRHFRADMTRLASAIAEALPDVPPHVVAVRSSIAFDVVLQELARWDEVVQPWVARRAPVSLEQFVRHLTAFVAAGLAAPVAVRGSNVTRGSPSSGASGVGGNQARTKRTPA